MDAGERRASPHVRALMANASEAFIVIGSDARIRVFNEAAEVFFGRPRVDVVGRPLESLACGELAEAVRHHLAERSGGTLQFQHGGRHLGCKVAVVGDGDSLAVVVRDDTELFEQQERAEAILAGAGDGLIVFTPDSHVAYVNPAAIELLGEGLRSCVGQRTLLCEALGQQPLDAHDLDPCWVIRDCERLTCPQYGSDDLRCWKRCGTPGPDGAVRSYREKQSLCSACEVFQRNGSLLDEPLDGEVREIEIESPAHLVLEVRTNPVLDTSGRYLGCISTLHDVTAAREVAIMKNEFVSMVSHELRTPLTSIKGYVDLIVDGEAGEINDIQREFLGIVQENSDRLVALINDLLDISRIESGRVHLHVEPLDPADIVKGVMDTFRTFADQSSVTMEASIDSDLPRVAADADRVGQVLMNLTSNAIKYSPGGGHVTLSVRMDDGFVVFGVTDTGIGISDEDQRQLFTKFFRVDSSLTREIGGSGLGLSICKSVVELHGGTIWATSVEGEGSTFAFSIPVAPQDLVRTPTVEGPARSRGGTVLVVDSDARIAELICSYLQQRGYETVTAGSAKAAFDVAVRLTPSLITLDVMLDAGDGFELLQRLKDEPTTSAIPVVVLSIVTDEGKSLRFGAADYLEKPIDRPRLMKLVDDLIGAKASPVVLVVDDDRHIVDSLSHMLRSKGFAVAQAYDGREALLAVETSPPDLILLDLKMPVMDGYHVIQSVKAHESTKHIPIVVMTAHRIDHDKIDLLKLAAEHVAKPFSPETLVERVASVLGTGA